MPERPDIDAYLFALDKRIVGADARAGAYRQSVCAEDSGTRLSRAEGQTVTELRRVGKRVAIGFVDGLWIVIHLMIAGRLHWRARGAKLGGPQ